MAHRLSHLVKYGTQTVSPSPRVVVVSDPYVKVEMYVNGMREGKAKCKVRQNTQDPVWHHQVVFEINRENPKLLGHVFVFHVLHKDMMTGVHKIGQVGLRVFLSPWSSGRSSCLSLALVVR